MWLSILSLYIGLYVHCVQCGMLYPRESETREVKLLDGLWNFRADMSPTRRASFDDEWQSQPLKKSGNTILMPVPSSYNDITQDKCLRDFVGWAWYDRQVYVPKSWVNSRIVLRIDSAHYSTIVWVNGEKLVTHSGGHLPFEAPINKLVTFNKSNRITIAINNTLSPTTLPPGTIQYKTNTNKYPPGYFVQNLQMDFFNYAGIHRSVKLYTTPPVYVDDITLTTEITRNGEESTGVLNYNITSTSTMPPDPACPNKVTVHILDTDGTLVVAKDIGSRGVINILDPNLWWPYTMSKQPAYLYTFEVVITHCNLTDVYRLPFGFRSVEVKGDQLLINLMPFYCHGVAKHEDSDIRGKGLDYALISRDFNLLKWLGANCFRTSHYPYAEEIMDLCDRQGIVVIDESPGVGIIFASNMGNVSLSHHLHVMEEMIQRDKNRPSVIMWSVANEPKTSLPEAEYYFRTVIKHTRSLDKTRPVTFVVGSTDYNTDRVAKYVDIICVNHYYGWYSDIGHTEVIQLQLMYDLTMWHKTFNKPMMITEYGADTIPGFHQSPAVAFTEEYQVEFLQEYHTVFDKLRKKFLVGEMIWNFADFMTVQGTTRVVGNKKGIFTRQRQPKMAAHILRTRYRKLINETTSAGHVDDSGNWRNVVEFEDLN